MKLQNLIIRSLFTLLLPLAFFAVTTRAQETARINLESLDKLAPKAVEVVRKEEKTRGGDGMVYARSFEFKQVGEYHETDLQEIRAQLQTPGWSRILTVSDKDADPDQNEITEIYVFGRTADNSMSGMTIITTEPKELTIVNIVGQGKIDDIVRHATETKPN